MCDNKSQSNDEYAVTDIARAGRAYIDSRGGRRNHLVNALGAEVADDDRLRALTTCTVCGVMGDPGDLCGRKPEGHRLVGPSPLAARTVRDE